MNFFYVDAFVAPGAEGNPAAVAFADAFPSDEDLTQLALEQGLPVTSFVRLDKSNEHHIRWFTPYESDFCGHGTLAAAKVLFANDFVPPAESVRLRSRAGPLSAHNDRDWIALNLPALRLSPRSQPEGLETALGAKVCSLFDAEGRMLIELESEEVVRGLRPDVAALRAIIGQAAIVTARADRTYDFVSRYFRKAGSDEDPVTGSAHCALAPFWSERLGPRPLLAFQASSRGGVLRVQVDGDRVRVAGRAVIRPPGAHSVKTLRPKALA